MFGHLVLRHSHGSVSEIHQVFFELHRGPLELGTRHPLWYISYYIRIRRTLSTGRDRGLTKWKNIDGPSTRNRRYCEVAQCPISCVYKWVILVWLDCVVISDLKDNRRGLPGKRQ